MFFQSLERLLIKVEQAPSRRIRDALLPILKSLISSALLRHSNTDVRVSFASCFSEITRITAPGAPYSDEPMKELFQLIVEAFQHLTHPSGPYYKKAVSILNTAAMVRSCLVMLDLGVDQLILDMFQHFLTIVRSNHAPDILLAMETVMTLVIDESEEMSLAILTPLLASSIYPYEWKLGEKVMTNCAAKLKTRLKEAVQSLGIALDDYASIVADICQDRAHPPQHNHLIKCLVTGGQVNNGGSDVKLDSGQTCIPRKRGRKPKSLMKSEEGYDQQARIQSEKRPRGRPRKNETTVLSTPETNQKRKRTPTGKATRAPDGLVEGLIGKSIRVWWPQDRRFYEGVVHSYDPSRQRHLVLYVDGDKEILNLRKERWELLECDEKSIDTVKEAPSCWIQDAVAEEKVQGLVVAAAAPEAA
ncbi:unnamed protein product [Linum tenue]|uniref:Uncharacterized protein n=1 Tax=Linum tenue TaxID=586396 RepID=A0AAV0KIT3_9ROSI|nr:unnamed protein product [Linum tenue]